jgi:hypothetical protein
VAENCGPFEYEATEQDSPYSLALINQYFIFLRKLSVSVIH